MKYQLLFTAQAKKDLTRLSSLVYNRISKALEAISYNPSIGKALKGELHGLRSYRIGDYRIIYEIRKKEVVVIILKVGHRKSIYR